MTWPITRIALGRLASAGLALLLPLAGCGDDASGPSDPDPDSGPVRLVIFGDSNVDYGYSGSTLTVASYVSNSELRLAPSDPHSPLQVSGKVAEKWAASQSRPIRVVNHAIGGTTTGGGAGGGPEREHGAPNARTVVHGITRFEAEVLGRGQPWHGNESGNNYPDGPIVRSQAFQPGPDDFAFIAMGINFLKVIGVQQNLANLEWMVDEWTGAGLPADGLILSTIAPSAVEPADDIAAMNEGIRDLARRRGTGLVDVANRVSDDDGRTWRRPSLHIGDGIHYREVVRDWIAERLVEYMATR